MEQKDGIYYEKDTNIKSNGIWESYYESRALQYGWNHKDDKLNGITKEYYESGTVKKEWNYKDGKPNGISKNYYESGTVVIEVTTKNGKAITGTLHQIDGKIDRKMTKYGFEC